MLYEFSKQGASLEHGAGSGDSIATPNAETSSVTGSSRENATDLESQDEFASYIPPKGSEYLIHLCFRAWNIATILFFLINRGNMNWVYIYNNEPW